MTMSMVAVVVGYNVIFHFCATSTIPSYCTFALIPRYINLYEAVLHYSFIS